jgi:hypothetical protein
MHIPIKRNGEADPQAANSKTKGRHMKSICTILKGALCMALIFALAGCATIFGQSSPDTLKIKTVPDKASVVILDEEGARVFSGYTPATLSLKKGKGYFKGKTYKVNIAKEGFKEQSVTVDTRLNGWYVGGNLLIGGLIGYLVVDPLTGAMWTLDTTDLDVSLEPAEKTGMHDSPQFGVLLIDDIPDHAKAKMVRLNQ